MSKMLNGHAPQTIAMAAGEFSELLGVGCYVIVGYQIISGTGPLELYSAQDDSGPFTVADDTLTAAAQKSSFTPASNVIKFKNTGGDTLTIKAQGFGMKRFTNC